MSVSVTVKPVDKPDLKHSRLGKKNLASKITNGIFEKSWLWLNWKMSIELVFIKNINLIEDVIFFAWLFFSKITLQGDFLVVLISCKEKKNAERRRCNVNSHLQFMSVKYSAKASCKHSKKKWIICEQLQWISCDWSCQGRGEILDNMGL